MTNNNNKYKAPIEFNIIIQDDEENTKLINKICNCLLVLYLDITIFENNNNNQNEDEENENNELFENKIQDSVIDDENINVNIDKYENEYLEFDEFYPQKKS